MVCGLLIVLLASLLHVLIGFGCFRFRLVVF